MDVPIGVTRPLMVDFGPGYEGLTTVGYAFKNLDGTTTGPRGSARTETGVVPLGGSLYGVALGWAPPALGPVYVEWDDGAVDPFYIRESYNVVPVPADSGTLDAVSDSVTRMHGLLGRNSVMRDHIYDSDGKTLLAYNLYIYDSPVNATLNDTVTGLIAVYHVQNVYSLTGQITGATTTELA